MSDAIDTMLDVDTWLDTPTRDAPTNYARFVIEHFRARASDQILHEKFMRQFKLFCVYRNRLVRVTGASRLGDVCISYNFDDDHGYDERVGIAELSRFCNEVPRYNPVFDEPVHIKLK